MILPENRFPPRIKSGAGFFGIMRVGARIDRWSAGRAMKKLSVLRLALAIILAGKAE